MDREVGLQNRSVASLFNSETDLGMDEAPRKDDEAFGLW